MLKEVRKAVKKLHETKDLGFFRIIVGRKKVRIDQGTTELKSGEVLFFQGSTTRLTKDYTDKLINTLKT